MDEEKRRTHSLLVSLMATERRGIDYLAGYSLADEWHEWLASLNYNIDEYLASVMKKETSND